MLYDIDRDEFEQFDNVDGLPSNQLRSLVFDDDNNLYMATADFGVAKMRFSGGRPVLVRSLNAQIDGLSSNTINSIARWGSDFVYGANPGMGTIRNDFASARYFERDGLPDDDVRDVVGRRRSRVDCDRCRCRGARSPGTHPPAHRRPCAANSALTGP